MPRFSKSSMRKLNTCHSDLQRLFISVVKTHDCTILCGHRTAAEQHSAYVKGFSKAEWPQSKHNSSPSIAVDVAPYPIDWEDKQRFTDFAEVVLKRADDMGIKIKWGGNFRSFYDGPHYELSDA